MPSIIVSAEALHTLDEHVLLALLEQADRTVLLEVWAPAFENLTKAGERFTRRYFERCRECELFSELEATGYAKRWRNSYHGGWWVAQACAATGRTADALALYRRLMLEAATPSLALALDAVAVARKEGEPDYAVQCLGRALGPETDYSGVQQASRAYRRLEREGALDGLPVCKVALMLSSDAQLMVPALQAMGYASGLRLELFCPDFNSVESALLDADSEFHAFAPEVVVLGASYRELVFEDIETLGADAWCRQRIKVLERRWALLRERLNCRILQHNFDLPPNSVEGHLAASLPSGAVRCLRMLNTELANSLVPQVSLVDVNRLQSLVGLRAWSDARMWYAARQHPAPAGIPVLAAEYLALIRAYRGAAKKVLVLDLDGTLWGGVVGEDGIGGIQVGTESPAAEAFREFQRYLLALKSRGVLLAVCSKNNEADARLPFERHDGMLLGLEDFACFRAGWAPKPGALREIAEALNLGLDSFVFIDDNPVERQLVREQLPEVTVVELPDEPADYIAALETGRWFETLAISTEDRRRSQSYQAEARRCAAREEAPSMEAYLEGLRMVGRCGAFDRDRLQRVAQLIQRTNQFNLTTRRHSMERLERMSEDPAYWTQWFALEDRFGEHGITGLVIARIGKGVWTLDTFLMSCRVIGRGFEDWMLATVVESARAARADRVEGVYRPTPKNAQVADFYSNRGFERIKAEGDGTVYSIAPEDFASPAISITVEA